MKYRVVYLGDLYASSCVVCEERALRGIAKVSGPGGCVEAIRKGKTYCLEHLPDIDNYKEETKQKAEVVR